MKKDKFYFFNLLIFKILLEISYIYVVFPNYKYTGFLLNINFIKLLESYLMFFIIFFLIPNQKKISVNFINLFFIFHFIPISSYYYLSDNYRKYIYLLFISYILIIIGIKLCDEIKIKSLINININFEYFLFFIIGLFIIYSLKFIGKINLEVFLLKNIYEIRGNLKMIGIINYLVPWFGNIIVPAFILNSFLKNKKFFFILGFFFQMIIFSIYPFKSFFMLPFFMIINVIYYEKKDYLNKISNFLNISILFSIFSFYFFNRIYLLSLIVRRVFLLPARINFIYYDYIFKGGKKLFYSEGKIGKLFNQNYPYDLDFANYIGKIYFGREDMRVNTGMFSDAYVNIGSIGIILISILLILFLFYLDNISKGKEKFTWGIIVMYIVGLTNSSLFTTLLTHGLIIALILVKIVKNK